MMALTMILKSFLVDPTMLSVSAISNNIKLPTITGDDLRMAPAYSHKSTRKIQGAKPLFLERDRPGMKTKPGNRTCGTPGGFV